jgi:hypothetical protein
MASDPAPKRSDDETEAETAKRRLIDAVREQLDEIHEADHDAERDDDAGSRP